MKNIKRSMSYILTILLVFMMTCNLQSQDVSESSLAKKVVVIPLQGEVNEPMFYLLRRAVKQSIESGAEILILDMNTPGGSLDATFKILKSLDRFPGKIITYVNQEAISAGALIAAGSDAIYYKPQAIIGAAAPIQATGENLNTTLEKKVVSYLKARVRAMSPEQARSGQVVSAMIDEHMELKIGEEIIKPKGELLSLTADEALKPYGTPPLPLLGISKIETMQALLDTVAVKGADVKLFESSWSEKAARYIILITPLLTAVGMLFIWIEIKTPGFGLPGFLGAILMGLVFTGQYIAGLSGHEPAIIFGLGVILILVEIFFFPGSIIAGVAGVFMILVGLILSMTDLWPNTPITMDASIWAQPLFNVSLTIVLGCLIGFFAYRFLPQGNLFNRMVLSNAVSGSCAPAQLTEHLTSRRSEDLRGKEGICITVLSPSGKIRIDEVDYEATISNGFAEIGDRVRVKQIGTFQVEVEAIHA